MRQVAARAAVMVEEHADGHLRSPGRVAIAPCIDASGHHWQRGAESGDDRAAIGVDDRHHKLNRDSGRRPVADLEESSTGCCDERDVDVNEPAQQRRWRSDGVCTDDKKAVGGGRNLSDMLLAKHMGIDGPQGW